MKHQPGRRLRCSGRKAEPEQRAGSPYQGGQSAAAPAARFPEQAGALVLNRTCASSAGPAPAEVRDSIVALVRANRGLGLKTMSGILIPDPTAECSEPPARFQHESAPAQ